MKRAVSIFVLIGLIYYAGSFMLGTIDTRGSNAALIMTGVSKAALEEDIREYYRTEVVHDTSAFMNPDDHAIKIEYVNIDSDTIRDVVAIMDSPLTCGSGGCIASIFLQDDLHAFTPINFEYAVKDIEVQSSITRGMHDLLINGEGGHHMYWDGTNYALEAF